MLLKVINYLASLFESLLCASQCRAKACMCLSGLSAAFEEDLMSVEQRCVSALRDIAFSYFAITMVHPLTETWRADNFFSANSYHNPLLLVKKCARLILSNRLYSPTGWINRIFAHWSHTVIRCM